MENIYKHDEMKNIVKDYMKNHPNAIISVKDTHERDYSDVIDCFHMFANDYEGSKYLWYRINPQEIVLMLA